MSQYPPPPPGYPQQPPQGYPPQYGGQYPQQQYAPLPYGGVPMKPPSPRPTSVTVIAILAIVFGSLGVLAMLCSMPQYLGVNFGGPNPFRDAMRADKLLWGYTMGTMVVGLVISTLQLFGGIASLSLKQSGRASLVLYSWLRLIVGATEVVVGALVIQPRTMHIVQKALGANPAMNQPGVQAMMKFGNYIGVAMGALFLLWPVIVLYYMSRPHVKVAFQRGWVEELPPMAAMQQQQLMMPPPQPPPYA